MSHYLTIEDAFDGPRLSLACTATPDAPCRLRPSDGRESWNTDDPDLTPGHQCWAIEWVEGGGWESPPCSSRWATDRPELQGSLFERTTHA